MTLFPQSWQRGPCDTGCVTLLWLTYRPSPLTSGRRAATALSRGSFRSLGHQQYLRKTLQDAGDHRLTFMRDETRHQKHTVEHGQFYPGQPGRSQFQTQCTRAGA